MNSSIQAEKRKTLNTALNNEWHNRIALHESQGYYLKKESLKVTGPYYNTLAQNEINTEQHEIKLRNFLIRN